MEIGVEVTQLGFKRTFALDAVFEMLALLQERLGLFLILPEIGVADFYFEYGELFSG
jgi:hypothetical protein